MLLLKKNTAVLLPYENNKLLRRKMHFVPCCCKIDLLMSTEQKQNWKKKLLEALVLDVLVLKGSEMMNSTPS